LSSSHSARSILARFVLGCTLVALYPAAAHAEWHIVPFFGLTFAQKTTLQDLDFDVSDELGAPEKDSHKHFGAFVSRLGEGVLGAEGLFIWTPGLFTLDASGPVEPVVESSWSYALMGNVVVTTPRRLTEYGLRPFASGGLGVVHVLAQKVGEDPLFPDVSTPLFAFNVGGGAIGFFTNRTGVRFEFRYFQAFGRNARTEETLEGERVRLRYMTASIGLVLRR
jgi:hypothetical protein